MLLEGDNEGMSQTEDGEVINEDPEISLHALSGWTAYKTMRVTTKIRSHELVFLIDSGSMHNFISKRMANLLKFPIILIEPFQVKVANGRTLKC